MPQFLLRFFPTILAELSVKVSCPTQAKIQVSEPNLVSWTSLPKDFNLEQNGSWNEKRND